MEVIQEIFRSAHMLGRQPEPGRRDQGRLGDIAVTRASNTLAILGLGSCVGVALYYPKERIGGLEHIRLVGEEVLDTNCRTMRFDLTTGKITVRQADGKGSEL
jgi:chemotaxis receptor (MCP) glutamine deamidase CheD